MHTRTYTHQMHGCKHGDRRQTFADPRQTKKMVSMSSVWSLSSSIDSYGWYVAECPILAAVHRMFSRKGRWLLNLEPCHTRALCACVYVLQPSLTNRTCMCECRCACEVTHNVYKYMNQYS